MVTAISKVDRANGFCLGGVVEDRNIQKMLSVAVGADFEYFKSVAVQEKYLSSD